MDVGRNTLGFEVFTNVEIEVVDKKRKIIRKSVKKHNKATRNMVSGILRFLMGHFTATNLNENPHYTDTKKYIPCFIGVGDGGVILDGGIPSYDEDTKIPEMSSSWNEFVNYTSKKLVREFYVKQQSGQTVITGSRTPIRKVGTTIATVPSGDMDTIYFYCEIGPGQLNHFYSDNPIIISELGLFASSIPNTEDLLAYVKLDNYEETVLDENDDETTEEKTRTLFVRSEDTVIVKWYITIAAIGENSVFAGKDENISIMTTIGTTELNLLD